MVNKITTPPTTSELIGKVNELVDGKQDALVSGTNIKTINNTSILGSGNIDIQGGGSSYTAGTGIDITNDVISVTNPTLTNTATGSYALTIAGTAASSLYSTNIGYRSVASSVGNVTVGYGASATKAGSISIGLMSNATGDYSIQLGGYGTNSEANSFYVSTSMSNNWKMLGSDGKIPSDRISIDGTTITVNSSGQLQASGGSSYTAGTGIDITNDVISVEGVKDQRNTSTAIKTWTGTRAQYDAIVSKDSNTLYNITDDTDTTLTLLEALYPVGSVYITTASTCPLSTLISGSSWQLVSSGRVLQGADSGHSAGTTIEAGLPNITGNITPQALYNEEVPSDGVFTTYAGSASQWTGAAQLSRTIPIINFDASRSNQIYGNSNTVQPPAYVVNIFRRTL